MFLDARLREIERLRQNLGLRIELSRRLVRLETALAGDGLRRRFADARLGLALARRLFARITGRK